MQTCPTCGQTYGLTHSCPGVMAAAPEAAAAWIPPKGFAPGYYLRQAVGIAGLDDGPILAASRDENALAYGVVIWLGAHLLLLSVPVAVAMFQGMSIRWVVLFVSVIELLAFSAVVILLQYGACHLLARWWFGARGTYLGILRALLLGTVVLSLIVIPVMGMLIARLWSIAILMRVFEEVEGIERMQAFGISLGVSVPFYILTLYLLPPGR